MATAECNAHGEIAPHVRSRPVASVASSIPQKRGCESAGAKPKPKVTRACDACKAKKSKCSGELPCETCRRRGLNCQYEAVYSRGKAPTPRRTNLTALLEGEQMSPPHPRSSEFTGNSHSFIHSTNSDMDLSNNISSLSQCPNAAGGAHDGAHDVPSRASPGLEVAGQFSDSTSGLSFLHRAWRRISNNETSQVVSGQLGSAEDGQLLSRAGDKAFHGDDGVKMPSLGRCHELLDLYFDVCIATYRLLHRPTTESWLVIVSENAELHRPLFTGIGRAKTATVLSLLAIASFHEEKAKGCDDPTPSNDDAVRSESNELFCEALRFTDSETGIPKLESAQSRLIQVLFLLMSCRFNQAWYTFGHALQIISALGLHRRDDRKRAAPSHRREYVEEQCRKRTFWVAYTLDKYLGVIFGRPRHYHDEDIDQDFPDAVNDEDMTALGPQISGSDDCHIEALVFHAKLAQIAERISREVYSIKPVPDNVRLAASHRLGSELRQWRASLPPFLGAVNPSSLVPSFRRQATALKLSYCHAVILTHRPFLLKNSTRITGTTGSLAKNSLDECIAAAQSVLEAVDRMAREGRLFHAFWWTHYVCFCALVVVYVWAIQESTNTTTLNERRNLLDQAERCLQHLAQATASNSPSRKYSIILQELRGEAKRKTARPVLENMQTTPSSSAIVQDGNQAINRQGQHQDGTTNGPDMAMQIWQPLFGSPVDTTTPGLQNFLDDWQTTDWLHLDSSAFGPFPDSQDISIMWMNNVS